MSRIFKLGANTLDIPGLWIAAIFLTGLLVQPVVGYFIR
jgi:hypothetical protein